MTQDHKPPRVPVDQAPAGPALDAAVAVTLGKQVKWMEAIIERPTWPAYLAGIMSSRDTGWKEEEDWREVPKYSTDIAAAWELVEELYQQTEEWMSITRDAKGNYWAGIIGAVSDYDWWEYSSKADTAPLAITRAYLKAKGVEFVEVAD